MGSSQVKGHPGQDAGGRQSEEGSAPLTPEERARLLAELEGELEAAERSIREEGTVTPDALERHMDELLRELAEEEEREKRSAKR